jgi:DNA-binding beta-propeller fold protein YncE
VRVVDGASFREVAAINLRTDARLVGARPRSVAFSPDGRSVYVGTSRGPIAVVAVP